MEYIIKCVKYLTLNIRYYLLASFLKFILKNLYLVYDSVQNDMLSNIMFTSMDVGRIPFHLLVKEPKIKQHRIDSNQTVLEILL